LGDVDQTASRFRFFGKAFVGGAETEVEVFPAGCTASGSSSTCLASAEAATVLASTPSNYTTGTSPAEVFKDNLVERTTSADASAAGQIGGAITTITRMKVVIAVRTKSGDNLRSLEYDVSLRGSKYQNERCYTGERTIDISGKLTCR
jgi:hypothetical protein